MENEPVTVLRDTLQTFVTLADVPATSRDIATAFVAAHPKVVRAATPHLRDVGLIRTIDEVSRRRVSTTDPKQGDLFRGPSMPRAIVVELAAGGQTRRVRKPFLGATVREVEAYLDREPKTRKSKRDEGARAIIKRIRPHLTSLDQSVGEGLAAAVAAERITAAAV